MVLRVLQEVCVWGGRSEGTLRGPWERRISAEPSDFLQRFDIGGIGHKDVRYDCAAGSLAEGSYSASSTFPKFCRACTCLCAATAPSRSNGNVRSTIARSSPDCTP